MRCLYIQHLFSLQNLLLQTLHKPIPREVFDLVVKSPYVEALLGFLQDKRLFLKLDRTAQKEFHVPKEPYLEQVCRVCDSLYPKLF